MLSGIGASGLILIILVALLLFGPSKLPELGRAFGKTLSEFKKGAREVMSDENEPPRDRKEVQDPHNDKNNDRNHDDHRRLPE